MEQKADQSISPADPCMKIRKTNILSVDAFLAKPRAEGRDTHPCKHIPYFHDICTDRSLSCWGCVWRPGINRTVGLAR